MHATKFTIMEADKDNLYARWLEGQLNPEEEANLQSSGELEELEAIIEVADKLVLPKYDASKGFAKFKAKHQPQKEATIRPIRQRRLWPILAIAASVALLIGAFFLLNQGPDYLETGNKLTLTHIFSDQTTVVLNDGSSLSYQEADWATTRSVELKGEAIFNVQSGKPFIVNTNTGTVEVLGTSFNVRAWSDNLNIECYEGTVRVRYGGKETILNAGESVNGIAGNLENKLNITHQKPLWSTGNSKFHNEPVYQVFKELERQYDVQINSSQIERPFNGTFRHDDLETALKDICLPMNLDYTIAEDGKTVRIIER